MRDAGQSPSPTKGDDKQAIIKLSDEWLGAEIAKDVEKLVSLVTDDAVFLPPNAPAVTGKQAVGSMYRTFFTRFNIVHTVSYEEILLAGDWAFAWGSESLTLTSVAGGQSVTFEGKGMTLLRRQADGSWKFARGINNMSQQNTAPASNP